MVENCQKNWWGNLLYINNLYPIPDTGEVIMQNVGKLIPAAAFS